MHASTSVLLEPIRRQPLDPYHSREIVSGVADDASFQIPDAHEKEAVGNSSLMRTVYLHTLPEMLALHNVFHPLDTRSAI